MVQLVLEIQLASININEKIKYKIIDKLVLIIILRFVKRLDTTKVKFIALNNEPYLARNVFTDLNPNEICYYPFMVNLDTCNVRCNTLNGP